MLNICWNIVLKATIFKGM